MEIKNSARRTLASPIFFAWGAQFVGRELARAIGAPASWRPTSDRLKWSSASKRKIALASFAAPAAIVALFAFSSLGAAEPLTHAADVLSLPAELAGQRLPITVTGVVTASESDWLGQFFLQDATGGVFVENFKMPGPSPGDLVTVEGVSHPGAFAPIISAPKWRKIGTAPLPAAKPVLIENLESGVEDGERVEISGVVRTVEIEGTRLNIDLAVGGYRLQVCAKAPATGDLKSLVAARVRVRGTAATHYNAALRHLTSVAVYVPTHEDFTVLEAETADPFNQPIIPLNSVAQYRRGSGSAKRVHVLGTLTLQRLGQDIFIQDASGGIRIESTRSQSWPLGAQVEAVGFLEYENHLPLLRDTALKAASSPPTSASPILPTVVPIDEIKNGLHHAELITLRGKIVDRATRPVTQAVNGFSGVVTTWLIQGGELGFTVEREDHEENAALAAIPVGSVVEVDGVCLADADPAGKLRTLRLLLASPGGMRVLVKPSWLTPARLLVGVAILSAGLILVLAWSLTVSKKNARLRFLLSELEKAHDTLEQKVIERSAQLQVEMTARKAAELQFKAVLAERTRLARDLHDTLEQTLTGIALELDTTAKLFQRSPEGSNDHLQLARNWLRQSQVELRRSIWDLRSRELEQFDLANALRQSAEHLVDGTAMQLSFAAHGEKRSLPEVVEENVLRIGQEALTNVVKHANANRVGITLEFGATSLLLRIEDNGTGFEYGQTPVPGDNHFGLLGMSERTKRLGGKFTVQSSHESGTRITVEIPLTPTTESVAPGSVGRSEIAQSHEH